MSTLLDLKTAADQLGLTPLDVLRLVATKRLPASLVGDRPDPTAWRVSSDAIARDLPQARGPRIDAAGRFASDPHLAGPSAFILNRLSRELEKMVPDRETLTREAATAGDAFSETRLATLTPAIKSILEAVPAPLLGSYGKTAGTTWSNNAAVLLARFVREDVACVVGDRRLASTFGVEHLPIPARLYASPTVHAAYCQKLAERFKAATLAVARVSYAVPAEAKTLSGTVRFVIAGNLINATPEKISTIAL